MSVWAAGEPVSSHLLSFPESEGGRSAPARGHRWTGLRQSDRQEAGALGACMALTVPQVQPQPTGPSPELMEQAELRRPAGHSSLPKATQQDGCPPQECENPCDWGRTGLGSQRALGDPAPRVQKASVWSCPYPNAMQVPGRSLQEMGIDQQLGRGWAGRHGLVRGTVQKKGVAAARAALVRDLGLRWPLSLRNWPGAVGAGLGSLPGDPRLLTRRPWLLPMLSHPPRWSSYSMDKVSPRPSGEPRIVTLDTHFPFRKLFPPLRWEHCESKGSLAPGELPP